MMSETMTLFRVRRFRQGQVLTLMNDIPLNKAETLFHTVEEQLRRGESVVLDQLVYDLLDKQLNTKVIKEVETIGFACFKRPEGPKRIRATKKPRRK